MNATAREGQGTLLRLIGGLTTLLAVCLVFAQDAAAAIINTQNARVRILLDDGFGVRAVNYGVVGVGDGNEPVIGGATVNLNQGGFVAGANYQPLGIFPVATNWGFDTRPINGGGNGAATTGGLTAGFNPNFFGFAMTQNILLSQFDPADGLAKAGDARLRVDFSADFQNNAAPIAAAGVLGIFTNFFGNLPALGDFAEGAVELTMSNHGGADLTVHTDVGGDGGAPHANFWHRSNGPTVGAFIDDISNSVAFPGVAANALVRLEGHLEIIVDPGSVTLEDINADTFVPEPATATLLLGLTGLLVLHRRRCDHES